MPPTFKETLPVGIAVGLVYDLRSDYLAEGYSPEQAAEFDSDETISAI